MPAGPPQATEADTTAEAPWREAPADPSGPGQDRGGDPAGVAPDSGPVGVVYRAPLGALPRRPTLTVSPVPEGLAAEMHRTFGVEVGDVPVFLGEDVADRSRALGARAFTTQGAVFLPAGPESLGHPEVRGLLAHELMHAAQQRSAMGGPGPEPGHEEAEVEARIAEQWAATRQLPPPGFLPVVRATGHAAAAGTARRHLPVTSGFVPANPAAPRYAPPAADVANLADVGALGRPPRSAAAPVPEPQPASSPAGAPPPDAPSTLEALNRLLDQGWHAVDAAAPAPLDQRSNASDQGGAESTATTAARAVPATLDALNQLLARGWGAGAPSKTALAGPERSWPPEVVLGTDPDPVVPGSAPVPGPVPGTPVPAPGEPAQPLPPDAAADDTAAHVAPVAPLAPEATPGALPSPPSRGEPRSDAQAPPPMPRPGPDAGSVTGSAAQTPTASAGAFPDEGPQDGPEASLNRLVGSGAFGPSPPPAAPAAPVEFPRFPSSPPTTGPGDAEELSPGRLSAAVAALAAGGAGALLGATLPQEGSAARYLGGTVPMTPSWQAPWQETPPVRPGSDEGVAPEHEVDDRRLLDLDNPRDVDELAVLVYPRLSARIRNELLIDRERSGRLMDFR
ncbi:eCIS core domain-containing protein [Streptacidiphilus anmyonensis]|uniref:eCIS core domain-containing protein n=1 Tax=Streptacidiphilus anmyonensis TaxID=405782 RepID=UPI0005AB10DB|nr:DUF4157 domain-containing protein [Streptacidiphilus anmyonensis]